MTAHQHQWTKDLVSDFDWIMHAIFWLNPQKKEKNDLRQNILRLLWISSILRCSSVHRAMAANRPCTTCLCLVCVCIRWLVELASRWVSAKYVRINALAVQCVYKIINWFVVFTTKRWCQNTKNKKTYWGQMIWALAWAVRRLSSTRWLTIPLQFTSSDSADQLFDIEFSRILAVRIIASDIKGN